MVKRQHILLTHIADLAKAFDSIDRTLMLRKLPFYGITCPVLTLLHRYLSNRKQCVKLNSVFSELISINFRVPQRSILVPCSLLLLLFMTYPHNFAFQIFADETVFFYCSKFSDTAVKVVQQDLNKFKLIVVYYK